jgi:hypothetical protein
MTSGVRVYVTIPKIGIKMKIKHISIVALPLLLGLVAFFIVVGPRALNPTNIAWLGRGDPAMYYLGWLFYRQSDWSFPIGLNPDFGLELGSSVVFSGSNPLLAILFKPLSSVLPEPFQYFGVWLLACFILQAWFGWKLVGLISKNVNIRLIGSGLFVFSPPMLWRLGDHFNLAGQFLILAGLYLTFRPNTTKRLLPWGAVLVTAALVHVYLLAMVALLWLTDLTWRTVNRELATQRSLYEIVFLSAAVGFVCWQAGYFSVSASDLGLDYGVVSLNLLSIVDPHRWSYVVRTMPGRVFHGGFGYLGLGGFLLIFFSLPYLLSGKAKLFVSISKQPILLLTLIGLTLFAVSNKVAIGRYTYEFPLPESLLHAAGTFRASGRMFWPAFYALLFTLIFLIVRGNDKRAAKYLLDFALFVQVTDTSAGWLNNRKRLMIAPSSEWETALQDPFWLEAATKYKKVQVMPPRNRAPDWQILESYAGMNHLKTNAFQVARVDKSSRESAERKASLSLQTGVYDLDSLYVIDSSVLTQAALTLNLDADVLFQVDGFNVLAPGWKKCGGCQPVNNQLKILGILPPLKLGERIQFDQSGNGATYLSGGWAPAGRWGTWSNRQNAEMVLPIPENAHSILIEAGAFVSPSHPKQDIEIRINGMLAMNAHLTAPSGNSIEVLIPTKMIKGLASQGIMQIQFIFLDAAHPKGLGISNNPLNLALLLTAVTIF